MWRPSVIPPLLLIASTAVCLPAQTIDDGMLVPRRALGTGVIYAHDSPAVWRDPLSQRHRARHGARARIGGYAVRFAQQDGAGPGSN